MAWEHGGPDFQARFDKSTDKLDSETTRSEWGGLFREDISQAFPFELVQAASSGARGIAARRRVTYRSFDDPMGGRGDSWAKAIAHRERDKVVIDLVRAWPPATGVHDIAKESAEIGNRYGCKSTVGDNYSGEWPKEAFAEHGVAYEHASWRSRTCTWRQSR
jgi:hypothetical protein